jgi:hypothetical protein
MRIVKSIVEVSKPGFGRWLQENLPVVG